MRQDLIKLMEGMGAALREQLAAQALAFRAESDQLKAQVEVLSSALARANLQLAELAARAPLPGPAGEKGDRGEPGEPGEPGASPAPGEVAEELLKRLEAAEPHVRAMFVGPAGPRGEKGERGEDGLPGASPSAVDVARELLQTPEAVALLTGPAGPRGEKGERGEDGLPGAPGEKGERGEAGPAGPEGPAGAPGERGEKGERGEAGPAGAPGEKGADGTSVDAEDLLPHVRAWFGDWALGFERSAQEVLERAAARIPQPRDGKDGLGFDELGFEQLDERTAVLVFRRESDGLEKRFELALPGFVYRNVYQEGSAYKRGDAVTRGGSLWVAMRDVEPGEVPGRREDGSWRLAVKRGSDGAKGEKGDPGEPGRPGRDGRNYDGSSAR